MYEDSQTMTPEEKYHSAQTLLKQWLSEYASKYTEKEPHAAQLYNAKLELDLQTQNICLEKVKEIMSKYYEEIKNTPVYKTIQKNLEEVSKNHLYCLLRPVTKSMLKNIKNRKKSC